MTPPLSIKPLLHYLAEQDTPACAYYYDLNHLQQRIHFIIRELPKNIYFYYAIKANSDVPILKTLAPFVHGFEVASLEEIHKARRAAPTSPIAFGGPGKTEAELKGALDMDVELYHIESHLQLVRLNTLAAKSSKTARVLLRVNPRFTLPNATLQMAGKPTQFGIDQHEIEEILNKLDQYSNIQCVGFHFHSISNNLNYQNHLALINRYLELTLSWQRKHGLQVELLNIGGGIGISYAPNEHQFDWRRYCRGLATLLQSNNIDFKLAMECGRFVTATCGCYITEVTDIKCNHNEYFAILRGGSHHFRLPSSWKHNHPFQILPTEPWSWPCPRPGIIRKNVTLCGELCTPKDVLASQVQVERLRVADLVMFEKAGAYGWHISHHDFLSHPYPVRLYHQNGQLFTGEY